MTIMSKRKGLIRLLIVITVLAFGFGAHVDTGPFTWLYKNMDFKDIANRATFELSEEESCKAGKISNFQIEGVKNDPIYLICDTKNEGTCKSMKECSGLERYAKTIGGEVVGKGIDLQVLTHEKITSELNLVKTKLLFDMLQERAVIGFNYAIE